MNYNYKEIPYNTKTCGNCLYIATSPDNRNSECVVQFMKYNKKLKEYPRISKINKGCKEWTYIIN